MKDLIDTVLEQIEVGGCIMFSSHCCYIKHMMQRRSQMINNNLLITKRWHSYKFRIDGTLIVVDVKAEDREAAYKIMQDNYPDVNFTEVKVNG